MTINDGGPAYPARVSVNRDTNQLQEHQFGNDDFCTLGMSLRDHFAGLAMQSLTGVYWEAESEYESGQDLIRCQAETAYEIADAMLKVRTQDASHEN